MFDYWIATPLKDQKPEGLQRLKDLVRATCLRRTKRILVNSCVLPKRTERVEWVNFHKTDRDVYKFFKEKCAKMAQGASPSASDSAKLENRKPGNLLSLINFMRLICNHGEHLLPQSALNAWNARDEAAIDGRVMESFEKKCAICDTDVEDEFKLPLTLVDMIQVANIGSAQCVRCSVRIHLRRKIHAPSVRLHTLRGVTQVM
jgi:SNF2 family DNA or RNA helicase